MLKVVSLDAHRAREVESALEVLLKLARTGELRGLQYAAEVRGMQRPMTGLTGSYRRDTDHALSALTQAKQKLLDKISAEEKPKFGESK